jgi:hypothetical protein
MDAKEQAQRRAICEHAAKNCLTAAKFSSMIEREQAELFAGKEYEKAEYDKPDDIEEFKQAYATAYMKAQELMMWRSSPLSVTVRQGQKAQSMLWEQQFNGWDAAYIYVKKEVESAVGLPEESETSP